MIVSSFVGLVLVSVPAARAATIGVLSDGRQQEHKSILGSSSTSAKTQLEQDGHTFTDLTSIDTGSLGLVDVVWLPLLDHGQTYTAQEQVRLHNYVMNGGSIIWIGDFHYYNTGDNSFLETFSALNLSKFDDADLGTAMVPELLDHAVMTGPHGEVDVVGTSTGYGLFHSSDLIANVVIGVSDLSEEGTFAGFMDHSTNPDVAGRVAFICDTDFHGQYYTEDDHIAFLRNIVRWAEAAPGYTPSGTGVETGPLDCTGDACETVSLAFSGVSNTGYTTISSIGAGRCGFTGLLQSELPADFVGVGIEIETSAVLPTGTTVDLSIAYDESLLTSLGVDEANLRLYWYDSTSGSPVELQTTVDPVADVIEAMDGGVGIVLFGNIIETQDCNDNAVPDECDINPADPDGDGLISADCNENGIPDTCDLDFEDPDGDGSISADCNNNEIPDECDIDPDDPDGNDEVSIDCNDNDIPDECETGLLPTISEQPVGQVICIGEGVTLTVEAEGYGELSYQWRLGGTNITGATESTYTIDSATLDDAGDYVVSVSSACGTITSDVVTVSVLEGPEISEAPQAEAVCEGEAAEFSTTATGMGTLTYAWKLNGEALEESDAITGTATDTLHIEPAELAHAGDYTCVITDDCGETETTVATLTVNGLTLIETQPEDIWACPGSNVAFEVVASGADLTYRWQRNTGAGFEDLSEGGDYNGVASAVLHIAEVLPAVVGSYRCIVDGACGLAQTSDAASLTVGTVVAVQTPPTSQFACLGDDASFEIAAIGDDLEYTWQHNDGGGFYDLEESDTCSGVETPMLSLSSVTLAEAGSYRCVVRGTCGPQVSSQAATLTVGSAVHLYAGPTDRIACPGDSVYFQATATGTNIQYQWQFDDGSGYVDLTDGADIAGATTSTVTLSDISEASVGNYRCALDSACGGATHTPAAALSLYPITQIAYHPTGAAICEGGGASFSVTAEGLDLEYAWQFNGSGTWQPLEDDGYVSGSNTPTLIVTDVTADQVGSYRCSVSGMCGAPALSEEAELTTTPGACDCNENGILDEEDIATGPSTDCNTNGVPDECDIALDPTGDCNDNDILDACEISDGADDCNEDGILDECQMEGHDCNEDGIFDSCQLEDNDCNQNGIPDECDPPYVADAGEDFTACLNEASVLLGGETVATGSNPPYAYQWQVISGPEDGGSITDPTLERPRFIGTIEGTYVVELQVSDSTDPACIVTDTVTISVTHLTVEVDESFAMCSDATSETLSPIVSGGIPPYSYSWTLDESSTSVSSDQFTGTGAESASPTFTPDYPGQYTLNLTVHDSNDPPCTASASLTITAAMIELTMGSGFTMSVNTESAPLPFSLTGGGTAPVTYAWSIDPESPSTDLTQFGGDGPSGVQPTFKPTMVGTYALRVTVTDSSVPACEDSAVVYVTVVSMSVDAGDDTTLCVNGSGLRLGPIVDGGHGARTYVWTIQSGPSLAPSQFSDSGAACASPLFIPAARGSYELLLTVTDSATPPCVATDWVILRATSIDADAGSSTLLTKAFQPSRELGAVPVAVGGSGSFEYEWEVLSGPNVSTSQFSNPNIEHPLFTPAAVGSYELRVTATDVGGYGCSDSDTLVVEAYASELTLPINSQGLLYMPLRLTTPLTGGVVRISRGTPGVVVTARMYDEGSAADYTGLITIPGLSRRLSVTPSGSPGTPLLIVSMFYDDSELSGFNPADLRLHWFNGSNGRWIQASSNAMEKATAPTRVVKEDLWRQGVDTQAKCVWAVVDFFGTFSIGVPDGSDPTIGEPIPTTDQSGDGGDDASTGDDPTAPMGLPFCGALGASEAGLLLPMLIGWMAHSRRRRTP